MGNCRLKIADCRLKAKAETCEVKRQSERTADYADGADVGREAKRAKSAGGRRRAEETRKAVFCHTASVQQFQFDCVAVDRDDQTVTV